jgi:hypothetical protein
MRGAGAAERMQALRARPKNVHMGESLIDEMTEFIELTKVGCRSLTRNDQ